MTSLYFNAHGNFDGYQIYGASSSFPFSMLFFPRHYCSSPTYVLINSRPLVYVNDCKSSFPSLFHSSRKPNSFFAVYLPFPPFPLSLPPPLPSPAPNRQSSHPRLINLSSFLISPIPLHLGTPKLSSAPPFPPLSPSSPIYFLSSSAFPSSTSWNDLLALIVLYSYSYPYPFLIPQICSTPYYVVLPPVSLYP